VLSVVSSDTSTFALSDTEGGRFSPKVKSWVGIRKMAAKIKTLGSPKRDTESKDMDDQLNLV